jgi:Zn-dependent M28 family amino/carboxypeptidase
MFKGYLPQRTIRFILFVNEELPFAKTELMGSVVHAKGAYEKKENIVGMMSVETIGFYSDQPKSQRYPFPFNYFYPDTGNFIAFVSNLQSRDFLHKSISAFRATAPSPSEGLAAPQFTPGIDRSDHWSFWKYGYPAIMITDTAPYRYPYYHTAQDTPDKIDYDKVTHVVYGLAQVIKTLAQ